MDLLKLPYEIPFSHKWKISKSEAEETKTKAPKQKLINSKEYFVSKITGIQYHFFLSIDVPSSDGKELETRIGLALKPGIAKEVKAEYKISIESVNFCDSVEMVYTKDDGSRAVICKNGELFDEAKKYFVNEELVIKIDGILKFDRPLISKVSYPFAAKGTMLSTDLEPLKTSTTNGYISNCLVDLPSNCGIIAFLTVHPNGYCVENREKSFISLSVILKNEKKVETVATLTINSGIHSHEFASIFDASRTHQVIVCSTEDFFDPRKGYFVNGEMNLEIKGCFFVNKGESHFALRGNEFNDNNLSKEKNFKVIVGENEVDVNKELLADVSTVWNRMLQSGMKETIEGKMEIIDFPFKVVDAAIKFINGISQIFTLEDMLPLLVFSDKYDIQLIKDLVEDRLVQDLLPSNVCQLIHFSNLFNAQKLYEKSTEFFIQCSRNSVAVNDLDLIEKMFYKIFSSTFPPSPF